MTAFEWSWGDSPLMFLPQRALWRAEGRELFVADLHLGKADPLLRTHLDAGATQIPSAILDGRGY